MSEPTILDLRGLKCPLPVLRTRKALRRLPPGSALVVLSTDPLAGLDIPHMAAEDGHKLVRQWEESGASAFHLVKASPPAQPNNLDPSGATGARNRRADE